MRIHLNLKRKIALKYSGAIYVFAPVPRGSESFLQYFRFRARQCLLFPNSFLRPAAKFNIFLSRLHYQVPGRLFTSRRRRHCRARFNMAYIK